MKGFLGDVGRGLTAFGAGFNNPQMILALQQQEQRRNQEQQALRDVGRILSGQNVPAFLRPGGAEGMTPQQFVQRQAGALAQIGTPQALEAIGQFVPTPLQQRAMQRQERQDQRQDQALGIQRERIDIQRADLERKREDAARRQQIFESILSPQSSDIGIKLNATEATLAGDDTITALKAQRERLLPGLALPETADLTKGRIQAIDEEIKFQRQLASEKRKREEKLTPENASKVALVEIGLEQLDEIESILKNDKNEFDNVVVGEMQANLPGSTGRKARSLFLNAINAQLRAESGAAVPEEEMSRGFERFVPSVFDADDTKQTKIDALRRLLQKTRDLVKGPPASPAAVENMNEAAPPSLSPGEASPYTPEQVQQEIQRRRDAGLL